MTEDQDRNIRGFLAIIVNQVYPEQKIIPATDGYVFREIADCTGVKEEEISKLARALGYWPHQANQMEDAFQEINFPTGTTALFLEDPFRPGMSLFS